MKVFINSFSTQAAEYPLFLFTESNEGNTQGYKWNFINPLMF